MFLLFKIVYVKKIKKKMANCEENQENEENNVKLVSFRDNIYISIYNKVKSCNCNIA